MYIVHDILIIARTMVLAKDADSCSLNRRPVLTLLSVACLTWGSNARIGFVFREFHVSGSSRMVTGHLNRW